MKTKKTHAKGEHMRESRLGVPVHSSLCGAVNTLTGYIRERHTQDITCERCAKAIYKQWERLA